MSYLLAPPFECPALPFATSIPGGNVRVGQLIRIQGAVPIHAHRFLINLAYGSRISEPDMSDIAFHFNPRFDEGRVVRNTLVDNTWGSEETSNPSHLPFVRGRPFEVIILVEEHEYKVAVDGAHFLGYKHRIPVCNVTSLHVMGNVEIFKIEVFGSQAPVPTYGFGGVEACVANSKEIINPCIPFGEPIPYGMAPGRSIFITGRPKPYAARFSINLTCNSDDDSDICFHFNPRFGERDDEPSSVVVRNTREGGEWGEEERSISCFPFHPGFNFDLTITCEPLNFLVAVNGEHFVSYRHRLPYEIINFLCVTGDVDVIVIRFG